MSCACFPCFQSNVQSQPNDELPIAQARDTTTSTPPPAVYIEKQAPLADAGKEAEAQAAENGDDSAKSFTFRELATATKNFRQECLLGEGGFGRVFRGTLQSSGQIVAVRQLDRSGTQGSKEFQVEVLMLSLLHHPNLVPLIGYCADGDQRLLVYEYMPSGSLKNHLFDLPPNKKPLNWSARMKIASGIAEGLEYLHEKANPPIIYRDLKSSNILLDEVNNPRLSEYGLAKLLQSGNKMHVSPRVMAGYGYCAPEYERYGDLTSKSDVYSFGVVLLELITGRKALDTARPTEEQNLVSWAQPIFRDPSRFPDMADPLLRREFSITSLNQAVGVASMCLQEEPSVRPLISDVVAAIGFLATAPPETPVPARLVSILSSRVDTSNQHGFNHSIKEGNFSSRKEEEYSSESSDSEDESQKHILEEHKDTDEQDDEGNSASSDDEDTRDKSQRKFKESSKWGSSSNGESKVRSQSKHSHTSSRKSSFNSRSSSIYSRDTSIGFSLRCDSSIPEHGIPSNSMKGTVQESHDSDAGSSSDEESWNNTSHDRNDSINSRSNISTNKSMSSKTRQESFEKSISSYSRNSSNASSKGGDTISSKQHDNMESSMRSNYGTESVYSRHSSIADSEYGDDR